MYSSKSKQRPSNYDEYKKQTNKKFSYDLNLTPNNAPHPSKDKKFSKGFDGIDNEGK